MYPYPIIGHITLYELFLIAGIITALVVLRVFSDRLALDAKYYNFCLYSGVVAIIVGYASAVLFQAFYNYGATGVFELNAQTGATFYGGLIGGAAIFLLIYFIAGKFVFKDGLHLRNFFKMASIAACCITAAHSLGRIGCLMAGCCHGVASERFGIYLDYPGYKVIPTHLYEAVFLALLFSLLSLRLMRGKSYNFPIYMISYGTWRYFIEYVRGDYRGETFVSFLTPSQLTAIVLVAVGIVFWMLEKRFAGRIEKAVDGTVA